MTQCSGVTGHFLDMSGSPTLTLVAAFGRALRARRRSRGLSQEQLSLESGVQRNFISLIETGQNQPTIWTLFRLAIALNVPASVLVADTEALLSPTSVGKPDGAA